MLISVQINRIFFYFSSMRDGPEITGLPLGHLLLLLCCFKRTLALKCALASTNSSQFSLWESIKDSAYLRQTIIEIALRWPVLVPLYTQRSQYCRCSHLRIVWAALTCMMYHRGRWSCFMFVLLSKQPWLLVSTDFTNTHYSHILFSSICDLFCVASPKLTPFISFSTCLY